MYSLIIVGAGGFGREVLGWIEHSPESVLHSDWQISGFLDANPTALRGYKIDLPILGNPDTYEPASHERFVCAIADPEAKLRIGLQLYTRGGIYVSVCHPSAVIGPRCHIGIGCVVCPNVTITTNVLLGDFVLANANSSIGHDAKVGNGCTLSGHVDITGNVQLGEGVFLGTHATVLPGISVGNYARIGAGSVVVANVPPRTTMFGVPAKRLLVPGKRTEDE